MDFFAPIIAHGHEILIVAGLVITAFAGMAGVAWLCGLMIRARQYALRWRHQSWKESQATQAIRLEMAARERAHRKSGSHDEMITLRKEAEVAKREIADLRKLNSAQEESLNARAAAAERLQAQVDDLTNAIEEMEEASSALETQVEECELSRKSAEKATADLAEIRTQLQEDLTNRELLIRMLEAQVATHQKSAEMANANAHDLQRELEALRRENRALTEKNELLTRLANQPVPAAA